MGEIDFLIIGLLVLPLTGALAGLLISNERLAGGLAFLCGLLAFGCSFLIYSEVSGGYRETYDLMSSWVSVGSLQLSLGFRIDELSALMLLIVTGIGSLIQLYSMGYMKGDSGERRYYSYVSLFLFFMTVLVTGSNLPVVFIGWEGVGLCSYLLIGFWFKKNEYCYAAQKAFVVNRIGDAGYLIALISIFAVFGTWNIEKLSSIVPEVLANADKPTLFFSGLGLLGLIFAVTAKSAQIPLFVWLPDAMAGPTPVSALIHAATMVTAGVYLLARMHFLCEAFPDIMALLLIIGSLTSLIAALTACAQADIKKVLAYSTVSQLGFMVVAAASGHYGIALFHVLTHAFFKACLFLGAGSVIHGCDHVQDMNEYGGLLKKMPVTAIAFCIASMALAGIAPFSGFYSKYMISHSLMHGGLFELAPSFLGMEGHSLFEAVEICLLVVSYLTAFYIARVCFLTFFGEYRGNAKPHEAPMSMNVPVVVLAVGSLVVGALCMDVPGFLSIGGEHFESLGGLFIPEDQAGFWMKNIIALLGIGTAASLFMIRGNRALSNAVFPLLFLKPLAEKRFFWDEVYDWLFVKPFKLLSAFFGTFVEPFVIDGLVNSTWMTVVATGECGRVLQSGQVRHYSMQIFGVLLAFLLFYMVL